MTQFKLTNIWGANWTEFWAACMASQSFDINTLEEFFGSDGENVNGTADDIAGVVTLFKEASSFRELFTGYTEAETNGIVSSISIVPDAGTNFTKICAAVKRAYVNLSTEHDDEQERLRVEAYLNGATPLAQYYQASKNEDIRKEIADAASYSSYSLKDESLLHRISSQTRAKIKASLKPKVVATKTDFAPLLSKLSSVEQLKEIIGTRTLFVGTDKGLAYDELNEKGRNKVSRDNVCAFRVSKNNLIEYWEIASYSPTMWDVIGSRFTEITGKSNSYGPRENIIDERLIAFILYSIKRGKKITLREELFPGSLQTDLKAIKDEHMELRHGAMEILRPVDVSENYKKNYKSIPLSFVFYNHDYPYNELRFQLGDKIIYFDKDTYSSHPTIEEGPGKDAWLSLTRSFLTASNYSPSNGYNEKWSVYKASASQKKQVYEKLKAASDKYIAFVKGARAWFNDIK
jgi:hypothetical protein